MRGSCSSAREGVQAAPSARAADAVVALLTPQGRGALAVVGVAGNQAARVVDTAFAARGGRPIALRHSGAIAFGTWRATGEEVVVVRHTRGVEVHCHGGSAASAAVIASLVARGAREVPWAEWLAAGDGTAAAIEAHEALARAGGPKAARILCRQAAGALDRELARIAALVAAGDDIAAEAARGRLRAAARVGLRLLRPWRVVLAGRVNAGKSSLLNAIAGHARSIVSPEPGTTRDAVETRLVLDGWEIDLVDVAGDRDAPATAGEQAGIVRAAAERARADLVLRVVPAAEWRRAGGPPPAHELLAISKCDATAVEPPPGAVATSALTGAGIDALIAAITARLVPEERDDHGLLAGAVPFTARQIAGLA